jgi:hypothetical protein
MWVQLCSCALLAVSFANSAPTLRLVQQNSEPVLTVRHPQSAGNKYGFEGGRVVRVAGVYHLFTSEMVADPIWAKMRLAHWKSGDGIQWSRVSTLFESSGECEGRDARAALWSPLPVWDPAEARWNLFYVAYRCRPNTATQFLSNHAGEIWRSVSQTKGEAGIGGPYRDVGVVLRPGADSQQWEGLQGTDSFFPYAVGKRWYALYGSAKSQVRPIEYWLVGMASADAIAGPWKRIASGNPVPIEKRFIENPIVTPVRGGFLCVYDSEGEDAIGYSFSPDGIRWEPGRRLRIQTKPGVWAKDVRTPLGLVVEGKDEFTIFYTGFEQTPDWDAFMAGKPGDTKCSIGRVRVRLESR